MKKTEQILEELAWLSICAKKTSCILTHLLLADMLKICKIETNTDKGIIELYADAREGELAAWVNVDYLKERAIKLIIRANVL